MINAGELNTRIELMAPQKSYDSKGSLVVTYTSFKTVWANYVMQSGREFYAAQKLNPETSDVFKIRYVSYLRTDWRVRKGYTDYEIVSINDTAKREGELTLSCKSI